MSSDVLASAPGRHHRPGPRVALGYAGPWAKACHSLAAQLTQSLERHRPAQGAVPDVRVSVLGVHDELTTTAADPRAPATALHLYGHHAIVGPGDPGTCPGAPCAHCLARRWQAVRPRGLREALELGSGTAAAGSPPWAMPFVTDALAALLAARRQAKDSHGGAGSLRSATVHLLDLETLRVSGFPLLADAQCPQCGRREDDNAEQARIVLENRPKPAPGTFRLRAVEDYDLPLQALVNPVAGMLGPGVVPDLTSTSTSSTTGCFTMRSGTYLRECFWGGHTSSYRSSARVGLLEGLERFAGMRPRARRTRLVAAFADLDRAVDPRVCGLYSEDFHRADPTVRPFCPRRPIPWVWGHSLRDQEPILVPEVLAYYHAPGGVGNRFVQESSNGCASGSCLEEAIYFALMEVIERDAFLIAWYGQLALPELDPHQGTGRETRSMVERLEMYGYRARFFDLRITFPIPVVAAVAERTDGALGRLCFGAGASLDAETALRAGLCEIATDAVHLRRRTARQLERLRAMATDFERIKVLHDHPMVYGLPEMARHADFLLRAADGGPRRPLSTLAAGGRGHGPWASAACGDLREDLDRCVQAVTGAGFDVVVVDQSTPEQRALGLRTAKVIVPGLLPLDFGWRRQRALAMPRLRAAPRLAGLREHDLRDDELNQAPHPFP
ncbi:TOMM precursor leader peptide-binding protein [Kitasatospora sp. GAS1066B]|uniref:TOMM precursor leader peptide-binding protein n=1 Tax=Kitasatospora sp. GAS1066B TaxID=3156271 RepID=UPI003516B36E